MMSGVFFIINNVILIDITNCKVLKNQEYIHTNCGKVTELCMYK